MRACAGPRGRPQAGVLKRPDSGGAPAACACAMSRVCVTAPRRFVFPRGEVRRRAAPSRRIAPCIRTPARLPWPAASCAPFLFHVRVRPRGRRVGAAGGGGALSSSVAGGRSASVGARLMSPYHHERDGQVTERERSKRPECVRRPDGGLGAREALVTGVGYSEDSGGRGYSGSERERVWCGWQEEERRGAGAWAARRSCVHAWGAEQERAWPQRSPGGYWAREDRGGGGESV